MKSFIEKTSAEQGFDACWRQEVAPLYERYATRQRRRTMFASLITGIAVGLGVVALLPQIHITSTGFLAQPLHQALVVALAVLAVIGAWSTLLRRDQVFGGAVRRAVELHFASLFTSDANAAFGQVILQDLVTDGILRHREYRLTANYAGTYGDSRVRMIEATAGSGRGHTHDGMDLLVFRVSLPFPLHGEIRADSRNGRLVSGEDGGPNLAAYHVDHDQFDSIFAIATSDIDATARLFTDGFAEMMLQVQEHLASPLTQRRGAPPRLAMQMTNGSLVMVIETAASGGDDAAMTLAGFEARARKLIVQFTTVPALVDGLQGRADTLPAFSSLPMGNDPYPVISV